MQVDPIKPPLKAPGYKRLNYNLMSRLQTLLSNSTCAATTRRTAVADSPPDSEAGTAMTESPAGSAMTNSPPPTGGEDDSGDTNATGGGGGDGSDLTLSPRRGV